MMTYSEQVSLLTRIRDAHIFRGVLPAPRFAAVLNRERDRADRTGQEFSVVVFESARVNGNADSIRMLVPILTQRVRSTDEIGWLEDGRIGVVLPHTTAESAWKFVGKVRRAFNGTGPPECLVFAYPSCWPCPPDAGSPKDRRSGDSAESDEPESDPSGMQRSGLPEGNGALPVTELEAQIVPRLPIWKRIIDVVGSLFALILLSPVFAAVALLIKVVSPGPVLFRQVRVGYMGRLFTIWKFRTMHVNADTTVHRNYLHSLMRNEKKLTKLDDGTDHRIIPFGKVLRAAGVDELPQLLNVFLGDMSLVGPRPCIPYEAREFSAWQMRRFDTVPGLTGLWQVNGKNKTTFKEMMRLDIAYTKKRAFLLDMKIFLKTLPAVVDQVVSRPRHAEARSKAWEHVTRLMTAVLAVLTMHRFGR